MKYQVGKTMEPLTAETILSIKNYKGYKMWLAQGPISTNGYVLITPKQNGYKYSNNYTDSDYPKCYGGITFDDVDPDKNRVIGFDTAHAMDRMGKTNWTTEKLFNQCKGIINQLNKN